MSDITDILNDWPYDPAASVRKIVAEDGRGLIQVRTPLGIEQYELEGRPDGERPYGCESVLEHVEARLNEHRARFGSTDTFELERADAVELQQEGVLYYYRYLVCFQIGEHEITVLDSERNLRMFDLVRSHCKDSETVADNEQYRPYVLRMAAAARSLMAVGETNHETARRVLEEAIVVIRNLPEVQRSTFRYEKKRSLAILRGMRKALPKTHPLTQRELLERELTKAVHEEDYERAADIRDRLKQLSPGQRREPHPTPTNDD